VVVLLSIELVFLLVYGLINGLKLALMSVMFVGLPIGLIAGIIFGLRGSRQSLEYDIQTVETLRWSWRKALKGGPIGGLMFGLIGAITIGLLYWLFWIDLIPGLDTRSIILISSFCGLIFGVIGILFGAIFSGLSREIIETKLLPNQGVRLSMRSAIIGGLAGGLSIGMIIWVIAPIFESALEQVDALRYVLMVGLFGSVIGALWYGGLDVIQHYTLRLVLVIQKLTPANYARFLDYAVDRIFLQKVGGGYRFIHRLLLEHFAEMDKTRKL
jgi:hypothetical protein